MPNLRVTFFCDNHNYSTKNARPLQITVVTVFAMAIQSLFLDAFVNLRAIFSHFCNAQFLSPTVSFHLPTICLIWRRWFQGKGVTSKRFKLSPQFHRQLCKRFGQPAGVASSVKRAASTSGQAGGTVVADRNFAL